VRITASDPYHTIFGKWNKIKNKGF
jgi:hypothetical protein